MAYHTIAYNPLLDFSCSVRACLFNKDPAVCREMITEIQAIVFGILQFIFVADVISTIILYRKLSKKKKDSQTVI